MVLSICAVSLDQARKVRIVIAVVMRLQRADEQITERLEVTLLRLLDDEVVGRNVATFLR